MPGEPRTTRRLFIAVMLPAAVQEKLAALTQLLAAHRTVLRPVRPEALHFTLRFLGDQTATQEEQVVHACAAATAGVAAFPLSIGGFGVFPHPRAPHVVWLGLDAGEQAGTGAAAMGALHRRIEDELLRHDVVRQRERFTPHLTLARVRSDTGPAARRALGTAVVALPREEQVRCTATAVSLVHSSLSAAGSHYSVLHEFTLE